MQKEKIVYIIFMLVIAGLLLLQFSNQNDNKFVLASEKAITSVVTIYTLNNTNSPFSLRPVITNKLPA